jgi:hypothetical protein
MGVEITLCVWKSQSACINHTRACQNDPHACESYTWACENHTACRVCLGKNIFKNRHACVWISRANESFSNFSVSNFFATHACRFDTQFITVLIDNLPGCRQDFKIFFVQFLKFVIVFISFLIDFTKTTDNWYGQQVFLGLYGHLAVLGFVWTGHGQTFQYTHCPYDIRTGGNPARACGIAVSH